MTSLTKKRVLFWLKWTFGNGLSVGTAFWLESLVAQSVRDPGYLVPTALLGFGVIAGVQQLLLSSLGWRATWWWLSSYIGWGAAATAGLITGDIVRQTWWPYPNVLALALSSSIFGIALGLVQMFACWPLRERGIAWPAASGLGVLLGAFVSFLGPFGQSAFDFYLLMLIAGTAYGWASGIAIVYRIDEVTSADARSNSSS